MTQRLITVLLLMLLPFCVINSQNKTFTVVIDAGHGGKDPGAQGVRSKEKTINLDIALRLGKLIQENTDAKVVYTRKADVFVELNQRADIANRYKADLFISIHANALKNKGYRGAETYTLGLANSDVNLDVAKRENAVILLEDNYKARYEGFDPNSSESYIIFEMMQEKYLKQSIQIASYIQQNFKSQCGLIDRGVKQAGFLVLKNTSMPSVLVEVGYISNSEEERYMNSDKGKIALSGSIYNAFVKYKNDYEKRMGGKIVPLKELAIELPDEEVVLDRGDEPKNTVSSTSRGNSNASGISKTSTKTHYRIQVLASVTPLKAGHPNFKGLKGLECYKQGKWYRYTYASSTSFDEIKRVKRNVVDKKFKQAFIVKVRNGKIID